MKRRLFRTVRSGVRHEWPEPLTATLPDGAAVTLRRLERADADAFVRQRQLNRAWLAPWEPTAVAPQEPMTFQQYLTWCDAEVATGSSLPMVIVVDGQVVGQVIATISGGSISSAAIGYWVTQAVAGRRIAPTAVALLGDFLLDTGWVHRLEVNILPENERSLAVVAKLQLREEGLRERFMLIDGKWRDHRSFAVTVEETEQNSLTKRIQDVAGHPEASQGGS